MKDIQYWHELMTYFKRDPNAAPDINNLCELDNEAIRTCIEKGYSPGDILQAAQKVFRTDSRPQRYEKIKKYIEEFEAKQK